MLSRVRFVAGMLALIWAVYLINFMVPIKLGVYPRDTGLLHLVGIFTSPLFHGSLGHIVSNSVPLAVLGFIFALRFELLSRAVLVSVLLIVCGNIGVWVFGGTGNHIGASGLIFAYFGYIIAGVFSRSSFLSKLRDVALAGVTMSIYGFFIFSLLSVQDGISWAGHAWGFAAGIILGTQHHRFNKEDTSYGSNTNLSGK